MLTPLELANNPWAHGRVRRVIRSRKRGCASAQGVLMVFALGCSSSPEYADLFSSQAELTTTLTRGASTSFEIVVRADAEPIDAGGTWWVIALSGTPGDGDDVSPLRIEIQLTNGDLEESGLVGPNQPFALTWLNVFPLDLPASDVATLRAPLLDRDSATVTVRAEAGVAVPHDREDEDVAVEVEIREMP